MRMELAKRPFLHVPPLPVLGKEPLVFFKDSVLLGGLLVGLLGGLLGESRKNPRFPRVKWTTMARRDGFEPATASFEDSCSIQLSYRRAPFLF